MKFLTQNDYLKLLVEDIHSTVVATIGADGHPQPRVIDMMLRDGQGIYFLTARGKAFYAQLMKQGYIALSAAKDKISISLRGKIRNIGSAKLDEIFEKNTYIQSIYPGDTRSALEVFCLYEADGEYFDIRDPAHIVRDSFTVGKAAREAPGYYVGAGCTGCGTCISVCPQRCIDISGTTAVIDQHRCLHCGRCADFCPRQAIEKRL